MMSAHPLLIRAILYDDVTSLEEVLSISEGQRRNPASALNDLLPDGRTPLNVAISGGKYDVARRMLELGANPDLRDSFRVDGLEKQPIHCACAVGSLELVRELVEIRGADPEEPDCGISTPLHHASQHGHLDIVRYLLEDCECDAHAQSSSGRTALWKAAINRHVTVLQYLLESRDCNVNKRSRVGESVLHECVRQVPPNIEAVRMLINAGGDVNLRDLEGNTPLHSAAMSGNIEAGEILLHNRALVNTCNNSGNSALHIAVTYGQTRFSLFLLNHGANLNVCNRSNQSAFYLSILHSRTECASLLINAGCKYHSTVTTFQDKRQDVNKRLDQVSHLINNPLSLMSCCRAVVRVSLIESLTVVEGVSKLSLPAYISNYLLLQEFS